LAYQNHLVTAGARTAQLNQTNN